ncbi:terpene cyclase/mutase family protein [Oscillochloris sp. ZM17-4]|uniref:prenyltransferase/squalene oxidase repeat-containing protein n=1 Tax=Oscillochloris sp. ZM17-4 TaxID=2866714 RepID=UPI001C738DA2|nr:prenyltransferase/squalene oxidase repeat-containing protein [Oscillochloris sp. ZM17-4]MBX0330637.1 terpene cyclase/mutase family protein [Oscillochloris sp. ZM17-4]
MRRTLAALAIAAALLAGLAPPAARAQTSAPRAAASALAWARAQQQADGGFPGFGPGDTADVVFALVADGQDPAGVTKGGKSPLDYLEAQAAAYVASGGVSAAAKLALAATAAGADPASFGGENLLAAIGKSYDPASGQYGADVFGHALALLAIRSAGATPPALALDRLAGLQLDDGGWSFDGTAATGSDTNTTSLALQALVGQPQAGAVRAKALAYLRSQQNSDGGFPYSQSSPYGHDSDANSTANVIQALVALGQDPAAFTNGGKGPVDALVAMQNPGGAMRYQSALPDDNALATYQSIAALLGKAFPLKVTKVAGAQALVAPAAGLPATGAPAQMPAAGLALAGLALAAAGLGLRRIVRAYP